MKRDIVTLNGEVITASVGVDGSNSTAVVNCKNKDVIQVSSRNYRDYIFAILSKLEVLELEKDLTFTIGKDGYYIVQATFTSSQTYWSVSEL